MVCWWVITSRLWFQLCWSRIFIQQDIQKWIAFQMPTSMIQSHDGQACKPECRFIHWQGWIFLYRDPAYPSLTPGSLKEGQWLPGGHGVRAQGSEPRGEHFPLPREESAGLLLSPTEEKSTTSQREEVNWNCAPPPQESEESSLAFRMLDEEADLGKGSRRRHNKAIKYRFEKKMHYSLC